MHEKFPFSILLIFHCVHQYTDWVHLIDIDSSLIQQLGWFTFIDKTCCFFKNSNFSVEKNIHNKQEKSTL